jgi:hypothetical protein
MQAGGTAASRELQRAAKLRYDCLAVNTTEYGGAPERFSSRRVCLSILPRGCRLLSMRRILNLDRRIPNQQVHFARNPPYWTH